MTRNAIQFQPGLSLVEFQARFGFLPIADRQLQAALDVRKGVNLFDTAAAPAPSARLP